MDKIKVVIIQNIIVPYEIPLFISLSEQSNINLKVFFCDETYSEREWHVSKTKKYDYEVLSGWTFQFKNITNSFNPSIIKKLLQEKPDVIILSGGYLHVTMLLSVFFCKLKKIPLIYRSDENDDTRVNSSLLFKLIGSPLEYFVITNSDAVICPGKKAQKYNLKKGVSPQKVFISPYTTEDDDNYVEKIEKFSLKRNNIKDELGIVGDKLIIYLGQFIERKGVIFLLDAFKRMKNEFNSLGLILVGNGPLITDYKNFCEKNNLKNVYFPGFIEHDTKIKYYSVSDVFVLPTLQDHWGLVVNEAMLCKLPVVITKMAGASEMVEDGKNGFIIDEADVDQLYEKIESILCSDNSNHMGEVSFNIMKEKFNIEERVSGFINAINYATGDKNERQ